MTPLRERLLRRIMPVIAPEIFPLSEKLNANPHLIGPTDKFLDIAIEKVDAAIAQATDDALKEAHGEGVADGSQPPA